MMRLMTAGVFSMLARPPSTIAAISTVSRAFSAAITLPMKGLSVQRRWEYTMSRCRVESGRSSGSTVVPPAQWICSTACAILSKLLKSSMVAPRRPRSRSVMNGGPYTGAFTMLSPPIVTLRWGLRA